MRVYLDDNMASPVLAGLLRNAGHDVELPADANMTGENDPVHLAHAIQKDRSCLTYDYSDFEDLHELILAAQGHHPGILVVRQDNDPRRDLKRPGIVRAIRNLLTARAAVVDQYIVLNHWR
jgi:predicted nuclease of predicted toxin-antitoxin system